MTNVGVYLCILEAFLQVVVDGLVGDLADEREIRHANFLLLGRLEDGPLDLAFVPTASRRRGRLRPAGVLFAACSLCDSL
jgi:hypothetical protein